jgi:hypothetical protein
MADNESVNSWRTNAIKAIRRMFSCHFRCCCSCNEDVEWIIHCDKMRLDSVARVKNGGSGNRLSQFDSITDL